MILNSTPVDCSPPTTTTTTTSTTIITSTTTTTSITTTNQATMPACQPPAGYTFEPSVDKYYKPVKVNVTWQTARAACSSEGSMLIELRTAMDYRAIRPIFGITFIIMTISIALN